MFTLISNLFLSRRVFLLGLCVFGVSACSDMPLVAQLSSRAFEGAGNGPSRVYRTADGIELNAPRRYCVDGRESRTDADGSFVLMAACRTLGVGTALSPTVDGVMTATIAAPDVSIDFRGAETDLVATLQSQSEDVGEVIISVTEASNGRVALTMREGSGISPLSWRGFLMLRGRMTTIALKSYRDAPLTDAEGITLLRTAMARFQQDNPTLDVVADLPGGDSTGLRPVLRPGG